MNKYFLKSIRDSMPETLKYLFSSVIRNKLVKNKAYQNFYKILMERESLNEDTIKTYQFNELKKILIYSNENVPYYAKLFDLCGFHPDKMKSVEELNVVPYLTKEIIRDNFQSLISTKKVAGGYYEASTGGSSGNPLKVLLDYDSIFKEHAFINYYFGKMGYQIKDRMATFRGVDFGDKLWKYNPMQNQMLFSPFKLSQSTLSIYVDRINKFKPEYLNGYFSSLLYFTTLLEDNNIHLNHQIKGIFLISEDIDIEKRKYIEIYFQAPSLTFYGHSERCILAEEIKPNEYVFDSYYGYTEFIESKDSSKTLVGTGFLNKTMPLIRYKTDDNAIPSEHGYAIESFRKSKDGLYGVNNEFFSHVSFVSHSNISKNISRFQFIQNQKGKADLLLIVNKKLTDKEINLIIKDLNRKTQGSIIFNVIITDKIILSKRGKYRMYISSVKE